MVNQWRCFEESEQRLVNVDQTHLILTSGKLVLKKIQISHQGFGKRSEIWSELKRINKKRRTFFGGGQKVVGRKVEKYPSE